MSTSSGTMNSVHINAITQFCAGFTKEENLVQKKGEQKEEIKERVKNKQIKYVRICNIFLQKFEVNIEYYNIV